MLRSILLAAALVSAAAPAFADNHRGRGGDRHDNRGDRGDRGRNDHRNDNRNDNRNWDRGRDRNNNNWNDNWNNNRRGNDYRYRDNHRSTTSLSLGILLGSSLYAGYRGGYGYDDYRYSEPTYYNSWDLYPGQCRWDREFAYWRGRPADVEVKRCADRYGSIYIVAGAQRLWRYR